MRNLTQNADNGDETTQNLPELHTNKLGNGPSNISAEGLEPAKWDSTNLISESAKHLYGRMIELDPESETGAMTACELAKNIEKLMRLQLDAFRLQKQLKGDR